MPKVKKDAVHRHFEYDEANNCSRCIHCNAKIKGQHATNLKNHLSFKHKEKFDHVLLLNNDKENITPVLVVNKKEEKISSCCLKLVTIHGRPFQILEDKAFQEIINLALSTNTESKLVNIQNIKPMIIDKAYEIKRKIALELQGKLVCLKLDSATYLDRSFIGINVQFVKNGLITIRTLATQEVFQRQTGEFLKEVLLDVLNDYKIEVKQIYCITTDNGRNFKKMAKLLGGSYEPIEIGNETDSETDDDEEEYIIENQEIEFDGLISTLNEEVFSSSFQPRTMLCAAHTLQLSIKDVIQSNPEINNLLLRVRQVIKLLRTPTIRNILRRANLKKPILDCPTRWSSTYNMLSRLQLLKCVCLENTDIMSIIDESSWETIDDLTGSLKPVYETTLKLQREQLTLGDFFIDWLTCKGHLEQRRTSISQSILESMKTRELSLLKINVMLEALYLDTRLNVVLSDREAAKARELLKETWSQLQKVKFLECNESASVNDSTASSSQSSETQHLSGNDNISFAELLLRRTEEQRGIALSVNNNATDALLREIRNLPRLPSSDNILTYWSNKVSAPELSELAQCVLATPATQVSVERLFSSVKFILSPLRSNLSLTMLENIMVIRSNHDLF